MFKGCSSLKELDLSNFNCKKLIESDYMFFKCTSLKTLNLSDNFEKYLKTNKTLDEKEKIFGECPLLKIYV